MRPSWLLHRSNHSKVGLLQLVFAAFLQQYPLQFYAYQQQ